MSIFHPYQCHECHRDISTGVPDEDEPQFCSEECWNKYLIKHGRFPCGVIQNRPRGYSAAAPKIMFLTALLVILCVIFKVMS